MGNEDYRFIVNASISDAIVALGREFELTESQTTEILSTFEKYLTTVTPWIPYLQVIEHFEKKNAKVYFVSKIEEKYYKSILDVN